MSISPQALQIGLQLLPMLMGGKKEKQGLQPPGLVMPNVQPVDSGATAIAGRTGVGAATAPNAPAQAQQQDGGWQGMLMGALQNPQIQQLLGGLMGGGQEQQMLQPPGLLMPQHQIQPFQMEPLTGLGGLLGGGHGRR